MNKNWLARSACVGTALFAIAGHAYAADGSKLRFPLSGSLGGEIAAKQLTPGLYGSVVVTQIEVDKVTGDDGNALELVQAKAFSQAVTSPPSPIPMTVSSSFSGSATVSVKQSQTVSNILLGYLTETEYAGGRLNLLVNIPYMSLNRTFSLAGDTPKLAPLSSSVPGPQAAAVAAGLQTNIQGQFALKYQAELAANSTAASGSAADLGDMEVTGAWVRQTDDMKIIVGATLAMPTAKYDKNSVLNTGFGNYYTLRPGVAVSGRASEDLTLGAKVSLGLNSPNNDNGIRTGNFFGLDLAAAYLTPVGVFGPHVMYVSQYEDDQGGTFGGNRFNATGAGVFYTTLIRPINAGLNFSYMQMLNSRNALSGSFLQIRLTKAF
ncbi:MAG: transporter [Alcaligenaceae bacterium]